MSQYQSSFKCTTDYTILHFGFSFRSATWYEIYETSILTGCVRQNENPNNIKIVKEPLLALKQTVHQQKVLDLSFNLAPWKWVWHYQEGVRMTCCKRTFFTPRAPMLFAARGHGGLLVEPCPLSGSQIKAEIKGFLLMYCLFLYY